MAKKKTPEGTPVTKEFMFKLTDAEQKDRLHQAYVLNAEIKKLNEDFKEVKKSWSAKIKAREDALDLVISAGEKGEEQRTVEAIMVKNFDVKEIAYWFEDDVIERRTMTDSELQMEANFEKAQKNARAAKQTLKNKDAERKKDLIEEVRGTGPMADIAEVHSMETKRGTKTSAVDGPTRA